MNPLQNTSELSKGWLVGTWEFVHTTALSYFPCPIVYHFDRTGINYWEYSLDRDFDKKIVFKRPYREETDGFWILWKDVSRFHRCEQSFDEIVSIGIDYNLWWMKRLITPTPDLQYFVSPDSGELCEVSPNRSKDQKPNKSHHATTGSGGV